MASIRKRTWKSVSPATGGEPEKVTIGEAWAVDYKDQEGKRHLKNFATRKAAVAWRDKTQHDIRRGVHTADSASITVAEAAERWIDRAKREDLERSTVGQYEQHAKYHINPFLGDVKLSRLTAPMVNDFRNKLLETRSRALARKVLTSLKSLVSEAQKEGRVAQNVARGITVKTNSRHKGKIEAGVAFPLKEEARAMIDKAGDRWRPFIVTAIFTGMRASELRGLTWDDVDFTAKVIHVRQRADAWGQIGSPKSEAAHRDIPMAPMVLNTLKEWKIASPPGLLNLVFPNRKGGVENHANLYTNAFLPLQVKCGIVRTDGRAKYGLHALRHFFVSSIIEQGFTPKHVQEIVGHGSITMTYDTYGHLFPSPEDDHAKMAAAVQAVMG